jgi:ribosomal protein S18 acetylase RimI-like enzyme
MGEDFDKAVLILRHTEAAGTDDQGTWAGGTWIRTRSLPQVHDANHVIVLEIGFGLSWEAVADAADEIQAGLPNRIVEFVECAATDALATRFRTAGWLEEPLGVMVYHRPPDRHVDTKAVHIVDAAAMRAARTASLADEAWTSSDAVAQVREKQERVGREVATTHLALIDDGIVVSYCEVFCVDDVAQIESVATAPTHRRRGYARAVVSRALEVTVDCRLVFLSVDPNDWPRSLYSRLGFDAVGRVARFRKALPGSR